MMTKLKKILPHKKMVDRMLKSSPAKAEVDQLFREKSTILDEIPVARKEAESPQVRMNGDWLSVGYQTGQLTNGMFRNVQFNKSPTPRSLPKVFQANLRNVADKAFEFDGHALGMTLIDRGRIVYQRFNHTDANTEFMGWSMSKSLTNILIGQALCAGDITSLNSAASQFVPDIKGTAYGDSTIKELLTMSSGAFAPDPLTGEHPGDFYDWTHGFKSQRNLIHLYGASRGERGKFAYDNLNSDVLGLVLDSRKDRRIYMQNLLNQAGVEKESHWMADKEDVLHASYGFGATLDDWAKIAQLSLDMLRGAADIPNKEGMRQFMSDGVAQIISPSEIGSPSRYGWGYTWTNPKYKQGYAWLGAYGQAVWVHPDTQRVLIVFRHLKNSSFYENMELCMFEPWVLGKFDRPN